MPPIQHDLEGFTVEYSNSREGERKTSPQPKTRNSSCVSCGRFYTIALGLVILGAAVVGVIYVLDLAGITLRNNISSVEFLGTVSSEELAAHDNPGDCWLVMHGNAYDLTEYAPTHPGGERWITDYCGTDATRDYDRFHPESLLSTVDFLLLGTYTEDAGGSTSNVQTGNSNPSSPTETVPCTRSREDEDDEDEDDDDEDDDETARNCVPSPAPPAQQTGPSPSGHTRKCFQQFYTLSDLAMHSDRFDCWYVLYDVVYDFTDYVDRHPGGSRTVFRECGTDATIAYSSISGHNQRLLVKEGMSQYRIGLVGDQTGMIEVTC